MKTKLPNLNAIQITVVGLGYVGLPLAVEFGKKYPTVGVDINKERIAELNNGFDRTRELTPPQPSPNGEGVPPAGWKSAWAEHLSFSTNLTPLPNGGRAGAAGVPDGVVYIVTVPTPIDQFKKPDLSPLLSASKAVGKVLKQGDVVIYESTVYPGCTEEDCVPVLERESGLKFNEDFFCGYSPERINPGDKTHTVTKIRKVTSGSTPDIADFVDELYNSIITAGTFKASSIKVAEAAKVIENCQRDINIAFVNELSLIFRKMNIDTKSVLEAAGSKWNFLNFSPGLVGGHCIGVDPYYLTYKAESLGYHPQVILAGRRINDNMGKYVAGQFIKRLIHQNISIKDAPVLVLGITFKENCPDIRNSRVIDIVDELNDYQASVDVYDPWADAEEVKHEYNVDLVKGLNLEIYKGIILAVSHSHFLDPSFTNALATYNGVVYDVKSVLEENLITERL